jgi:hypothetical protein
MKNVKTNNKKEFTFKSNVKAGNRGRGVDPDRPNRGVDPDRPSLLGVDPD